MRQQGRIELGGDGARAAGRCKRSILRILILGTGKIRQEE
jgi:hypothetical protein